MNADDLNFLADALLARSSSAAGVQKQRNDVLDKILVRDLRLDFDELETISDFLVFEERQVEDARTDDLDRDRLKRIEGILQKIEEVLATV